MKLINHILFIIGMLAVTTALTMCAKTTTDYDFPDDEENNDQSEYPVGLALNKFTETLSNDKVCKGFVVIMDKAKNPKLRFNTLHQSVAMSPSDIHEGFVSMGRGRALITTNAGYFWGGKSLSLLVDGSVVKSIENQQVTRKGKSGASVTVYPVRASFGENKVGDYETTWIYCPTDGDNKPYSYPSPLENDEREKEYMQYPPSKNTNGAVLWQPKNAIGGGPMLVKDGKNVAVENYWKEVFDGGGIAGTSRQPRTAIGYTNDNKLILIVCDGRGMNGSSGFTLEELADKLIEYGAVSAINLDGGGSSTMVGQDGVILNRPSDTGDKDDIVERKLFTAIVISEN